jgi:hypothetical protein
MKTRLLTALTATTLLALPAAPAFAQAAPTPGCQGIQITDKAGDNIEELSGQQGSPSSDVIAGWVSYDGSKAFANIQIDNLTAGEVDPPYVAIGWEMMMTTTKGAKYVRAYQDRAGMVRYQWGTESDPTDPSTAGPGGTTTGALFPGKGGVVQIELPLAEAEFGATPGSALKALGIEVRQWASTPAAVPYTGLPLVFPAPIYDTASGKGSVVLGPCPTTPAPGAPGGPAAPAPETPAPGTPGAPASQGGFDVKVTVPKLSAKKLAKARKFTVKLTGNASELKAVVRKKLTGGKTLASGKLATLKGSGKLTLKTKGKLKKGTYVLVFGGKNAQGQAAQGAVKFKVR